MREVGALISEYENLAIREAMEGQDLPRDFQPPFICPTFDYGEEFGLCERALTAKMFANGEPVEQVRAEIEKAKRYIDVAKPLCESPIESRLLCCLVFQDFFCSGRHMRVVPVVETEALFKKPLVIVPQLRIGKYRVDFALIAGIMDQKVTLAIECDGADFHDADYDAVRDRHLKEMGVETFRATGSEIFRNPFNVTHRIASALIHQFSIIQHKGGFRGHRW